MAITPELFEADIFAEMGPRFYCSINLARNGRERYGILAPKVMRRLSK
jgi:hypothetical protein